MPNEWLNTVQYPFVPREFETGEGTMRYLDEGEGRPIVFLHGNPTWSYLFRSFVRNLSDGYRCIAPDLLGYGLSDKPIRVDYRPQAQARRLAGLLDVLGVDDATVVVNCAGGPLGLSWAMDRPERVHSLVLFNTWLWPLVENRYAMRLARLVGNPLNRFYYRALNASPSFILPALFADRHRITRPSRTQYLEPFRSHRERGALYTMIESLERDAPWHEALWAKREAIADKPALLLWGSKDPIFGSDALARFEELFPNHATRHFPHSGRFVPEESPQAALEEIRWFLLNQ